MTIITSLATLGLESFAIVDMPQVKTSYRQLQKMWHPDLHIGKISIESSKMKSVAINNAYEIISEHIENYGPIQNKFGTNNIKESNAPSHNPKHRWKGNVFTPYFPDETVFEIFVKSSNLLSTGYNPTTKKLYIKFQDNSVYEYTNVPNSVFNNLLNSDSHGKFANNVIYNNYPYRRCTEENKKYNGPSIGKKITFFLT